MKRQDARRKKPASNSNVGACFTVTENAELMVFLMGQLPGKSRSKIKFMLSGKRVSVDGHPVSQFNHPLKPGQKVELGQPAKPRAQVPREFSIVYEDNDIIIIDKQAGLLSIATQSEKRATAYSLLSDYVKRQNRENKVFVVHRLDRETSGILMFARSEEVKVLLQTTWNESILKRTYLAVVEGGAEKPEGKITSYLFEGKSFKVHTSPDATKGQIAVTRYKTIKRNKGYSLMEVNLETGRKNQIRVHMEELGCSVAGDKKYGAVSNPLKRLGLHARQLAFVHPVTGKNMNFESPMPKEFRRLF